jgi:hypothetical protein
MIGETLLTAIVNQLILRLLTLRKCDGSTAAPPLCSCFCFVLYAAHSALVSSARIDVWDLLFSAHGIIFVSPFKGDTTKGGTNVSCVRRPV